MGEREGKKNGERGRFKITRAILIGQFQAHDSEEEWSTTAEADQELSSQKSPSGDTKSPSHSSSTSSNGADDEGGSPYSSRGSTDRASSSVPQQFIRVSKDHESTCARTELVFVHPPAEEKSLETATTKVRVCVGVCGCVWVCVHKCMCVEDETL